MLRQHVRLLQDIISPNPEDTLQPIVIFLQINGIRQTQSFLDFFKCFVSVQNPIFRSPEAGRGKKNKTTGLLLLKKNDSQFDLFFSQPTDQIFV